MYRNFVLCFSFFSIAFSCHNLLACDDSNLNFLVWNVQKAESADWATTLEKLLQEPTDFFLAQEAVDSEKFTAPVSAQFFYKKFFHSWGEGDAATGLFSGSRFQPIQASRTRSLVLEPISNTPKIISNEIFNICGQSLLVVNVHAINFVTTSSYKKHIDSLKETFESHKGPIFFAGDFNTWNEARKLYLDRFAALYGMSDTRFRRNEWLFFLDHIYVRGLHVDSIEQIPVQSSDHDPIRVQTSFPRLPLEFLNFQKK